MTWQPIQDLPDTWQSMMHSNLQALAEIWQEQKKRLQKTASYQHFLERLRRKIAIETGVIERLYTIDRGVTQLLIEQGIDTALIPHGATDKPPTEIVRFIRDHEQALKAVFDFVGNQRSLSTSFIKQLHQLLTRNQEYTDGIDQFGNRGQVRLLRGEWKKQPNNPTRPDGTVQEYCPPEHVDAEMDKLIQWHHEHMQQGVSPEVEAAWLHHRFTQIHPFQDGNGRVARNLASLVFIRAQWFPLVVLDDQHEEEVARSRYISALEKADSHNLQPLIDLFADNQKKVFLSSLSLSEETLSEQASYQSVLTAAVQRLEEKQVTSPDAMMQEARQRAIRLFDRATDRLERVQADIDTALQPLTIDASVVLDKARPDDERAGYYRYQIVQTATYHDYYANLNAYRSWLRLSIRADDMQTELLLSFHGLGYQARGVLICSACGFRRFASDTSAIEDLQPLSVSPFEFTYQEDTDALITRFDRWLDTVTVLGLNYWRKGL